MKGASRRSGFAMLLVLAFLLLFFTLLTLAFSQLGSLVRSETYRVQQQQFDQGPAMAMAQALALLETGYPSSTPYACSASFETSSGWRNYAVVFTHNSDNTWSVTCSPDISGSGLSIMPAAFTATTPPQ